MSVNIQYDRALRAKCLTPFKIMKWGLGKQYYD